MEIYEKLNKIKLCSDILKTNIIVLLLLFCHYIMRYLNLLTYTITNNSIQNHLLYTISIGKGFRLITNFKSRRNPLILKIKIILFNIFLYNNIIFDYFFLKWYIAQYIKLLKSDINKHL